MKSKNIKQGRVIVGGVVNEEGKIGLIWYFLYIYKYGTLRPVEATFKKGRKKRDNNRGDEPNQGTSYTCMKMSR
jgi:hypothetical protein